MNDSIGALRIPNDDLRPRLKKDEVVIYSTAAGAQVGDDVLVIRTDGNAVIREFVAEGVDYFKLKRLTSHAEATVLRAKVANVYPIIAIARPAFWAEILQHNGTIQTDEGIQLENS